MLVPMTIGMIPCSVFSRLTFYSEIYGPTYRALHVPCFMWGPVGLIGA